MKIDTSKYKELLILFFKAVPVIAYFTIDGSEIDGVGPCKLFEVKLNNSLAWHEHIEPVHTKANMVAFNFTASNYKVNYRRYGQRCTFL